MRRKFIDSVIGQVDKIYLQRVIDYGKVITCEINTKHAKIAKKYFKI